jgi:ABC-type phosphate/phosphonate transport system substrate-binding protein
VNKRGNLEWQVSTSRLVQRPKQFAMPDTKKCRECGMPVPKDAPFGNCPDCLVELGFGSLPEPLSVTPSVRFGDYELLETIGRGGMGVVYKARQISLNRIIALKMLTPHSAAFPKVAERLRLEAEAAAGLTHPNIVTIHDVGDQEGHPFFTMEFIEGDGMDKFIMNSGYEFPRSPHSDRDQAREPQASAVRTLVTIARAVDYAHKHGVLHRDLKPANVIVDAAGVPHLTDFGLAKIVGRERIRQTDSGSVLGTPAYMAPEQAAGGIKRVSTAADIYSLGAVFYEMLTGHPPFRGDTPLDTLRQVTEEEPRSPTTLNGAVDADLATICLKCLEKEPERRYASALSLAEDLERWLRHEPIEAHPVGTVGRFRRWCRRESKLAGMAVGLFILLTATTLLALTLYYRERNHLAVERDKKFQQKLVLRGRIDKEWSLDGRTSVRVDASELAVLVDRPLSLEGNEHVVVLGVHPPRQAVDALQILQRFALLVNCLQTNVTIQADVPLVFELRIYTTYSNAMAGLTGGEVDLMLLSPASYVRQRRLTKEITPLAHFASSGQRAIRIVIFSQPESGITRLADLKGKSLAFPSHDLPLVEDSIKSELLTAGLCRGHFSRIEIIPRATVVSAVQKGKFDAGVATLNEIVRFTKAGRAQLQIIHEVATPGYLWASTGKLPPTIIQTIQKRLVAIRDTEVLAALDEALTGFEPASPSDFDEVERTLEAAKLFDAPK